MNKLIATTLAALTTGGTIAAASDHQRIAVMETAMGNRAKVESLAMAKQAGYSGVQIHTGSLDDEGKLTLSDPQLISRFKAARDRHQIEIVSLCAGDMNRHNSWDPDQREKALSIGRQSIDACKALDIPILLVPFFGKAQFGDEIGSRELEAAIRLLGDLLPDAKRNQVILAVESSSQRAALDHIIGKLDHPNLRIYYDTGNMLKAGEDIYSVIEAWGPDTICQVHLKPFGAPVFGQGSTDLQKLRDALRGSGYEGWLVFEAGREKKALGIPFARENYQAILEFTNGVGSRPEGTQHTPSDEGTGG